MRAYLIDRVIEEGNYMVATGATVRKTAKVFHLGKSTVHKDVTVNLKMVDYELYKKVQKILKTNLNERHVRGGLATKKMYANKRKLKNA